MRIGFGYDVHAWSPERDLWLGGILLPEGRQQGLGLEGHSDADVLIHALCDAILGAANMRDIGFHFPPVKGNEFEGIDSKILLRKTMELVRSNGYEFGNCDCTICAEAPKINPHIPAMQECLAEVIGTNKDNISIKATTTERLGFVGHKEGMAAYAVVLLKKIQN